MGSLPPASQIPRTKTFVKYVKEKIRNRAKNALEQMNLELKNLEEENSILRLILSSSSDPILITSKTGHIIYVNPSWEKLTGYTFEEVHNKYPSILKSGKTPKSTYRRLWHSLSQGKPFSSEEFINKKKNGVFYKLHSSFFPISKNGKIQYYVQLQYDITERKKHDELRQEFLASASHELKTPLTVLKLIVQGHIARAKKQEKDVIKVTELHRIDQELDRLTQLVNDILDSSRFETGKISLRRDDIDITWPIMQAVKKMKIFTNEHSIKLGKFPNNLHVIADSERIEQIILNLVSNAVKYSPPKTPINIEITKQNNYAVVAVKDQGMGIPKNKLKIIFDKYYQVKDYNPQGFGLGLYIVREIIKQHRGKVWANSILGKGSTFYFSLPLI